MKWDEEKRIKNVREIDDICFEITNMMVQSMKSPKDLSNKDQQVDYQKLEENLGRELGEPKEWKVEEIELQFIRAEDKEAEDWMIEWADLEKWEVKNMFKLKQR